MRKYYKRRGCKNILLYELDHDNNMERCIHDNLLTIDNKWHGADPFPDEWWEEITEEEAFCIML